jgi:tungstate transport system ATP-binding protein
VSTVKYQLSCIQALYANQQGVRADELTFNDGQLHVLTGPNGSGKSTLLNILAFLHKPDRGTILFDGVPVKWELKECAQLRKRVTLLHQHPYMFSGTVAANVAFGPLARGFSRDVAKNVMRDVLEKVDLTGFESRDARELSGGESRRVAFARALACKPEVLLLDEPIAYVDRASAEIIESLVVSLAAGGITVVMSSHDDRLAARLGGRVIHLEDGKVDWTSEPSPASESQRRTDDFASKLRQP